MNLLFRLLTLSWPIRSLMMLAAIGLNVVTRTRTFKRRQMKMSNEADRLSIESGRHPWAIPSVA